MEIREITLDDSEQLISFYKKMDLEYNFSIYSTGERDTNIEQQKIILQNIIHSKNQNILIAEENKTIIGYLAIYGGAFKKVKNTAYISIGVLEKFRGLGIGVLLFTEMEKWIKNTNIIRLELEVVTDNISAVKLYKKIGFTIEGTKMYSFNFNGKYYNEYIMSKILINQD